MSLSIYQWNWCNKTNAKTHSYPHSDGGTHRVWHVWVCECVCVFILFPSLRNGNSLNSICALYIILPTCMYDICIERERRIWVVMWNYYTENQIKSSSFSDEYFVNEHHAYVCMVRSLSYWNRSFRFFCNFECLMHSIQNKFVIILEIQTNLLKNPTSAYSSHEIHFSITSE